MLAQRQSLRVTFLIAPADALMALTHHFFENRQAVHMSLIAVATPAMILHRGPPVSRSRPPVGDQSGVQALNDERRPTGRPGIDLYGPANNSRTGNVNPVALDRLHMSRPFTGRTARRDPGCRSGTCRWVPNSPRPSFNVRQRPATSAQQERANFLFSLVGRCRRAAVTSCGGSCRPRGCRGLARGRGDPAGHRVAAAGVRSR